MSDLPACLPPTPRTVDSGSALVARRCSRPHPVVGGLVTAAANAGRRRRHGGETGSGVIDGARRGSGSTSCLAERCRASRLVRPGSGCRSTYAGRGARLPLVVSTTPLPLWREANATIFQPTVARAAQNLGIPALAVEKDYWMCEALRAIEAAHPGITVFKGGTSLEKMGIIARFSEDLDLIVTGSIGGAKAGPRFLKGLYEAARAATGGTLTDGQHSGSPAAAIGPSVQAREGTLGYRVNLSIPVVAQGTPGSAVADPSSMSACSRTSRPSPCACSIRVARSSRSSFASIRSRARRRLPGPVGEIRWRQASSARRVRREPRVRSPGRCDPTTPRRARERDAGPLLRAMSGLDIRQCVGQSVGVPGAPRRQVGGCGCGGSPDRPGSAST